MLAASRRDVERLITESLDGLSAAEDTPERMVLELDDPEGSAVGDDAPHAAKAVIDATLRRINGFGKLRWGRTFEGSSMSRSRTSSQRSSQTSSNGSGSLGLPCRWDSTRSKRSTEPM